jgi:hypothetical protein
MSAATALGIPVSGAGSSSDFRGIRLDVDRDVTPSEAAQLHALGAVEIGKRHRSVPLSDQTPASSAGSRYADREPFFGGGAIKSGNQRCSIGVVVMMATGSVVSTTARHCGMNQEWVTAVGNQDVGPTWYDDLGTDLTLLGDGRTAFHFQHQIWVGGPWSTTAKYSHGKADPVQGQSGICVDGGYSGEHCDTVVTAVNYFDSRYVGPGYVVTKTGNDTAAIACLGDSGGPSYSYVAEGGTEIAANGVISSGIGQPDEPGNQYKCVTPFNPDVDHTMASMRYSPCTSPLLRIILV